MATTSTITTPTTTITDDALLRLAWLASPALPVGGFSYSEGLEPAVEAGLVNDEATAGEWIVQQLHLTLGRADLSIVAEAVEAWRGEDVARIEALDAWVLHTRETSELRQQTEQMGKSMVDWLRTLQAAPVERRGWTYPVAFALAASLTDAPTRAILLAFAFGWSENMVQAAIKSIPLGQSAGQRILARLVREIPVACDHALQLDADRRQSFSPMLAIVSAQHETQYSRLFRS